LRNIEIVDMSKTINFRLQQATFNFGIAGTIQVPFVAGLNQPDGNTHITLLMGANGTSKSRILASCVNIFRRSEDLPLPREQARVQRMFLSDAAKEDLECTVAHIIRDGVANSVGEGPIFDVGKLPSRVLAIANLVRDRFVWIDSESAESFYFYLGVRQASNMTSTGAMDRLISDSLLNILCDETKYTSFTEWVEKIFPQCQLSLHFPRYFPDQISTFLSDPKKWLKKRTGDGLRISNSDERLTRIEASMGAFKKLFDLIGEYGEANVDSGKSRRKYPAGIVLELNNLSKQARNILGESKQAINLASSLQLFGRPSIMLKSEQWLDFMQLSSGEQNLLATGARLLGFATPASLIFIDEPEVSLNVAWQQRYIELISDALKHAPGSHVIIASHSPYLVADLHADNATVVVVERRDGKLSFKAHASQFWGWGSEAILYDVLGLPSASNYHFSRELTSVLKLVQDGSNNLEAFQKFLAKCDQFDLDSDAEPLKIVIEEIREYYNSLTA
jgi:predicted ATPase